MYVDRSQYPVLMKVSEVAKIMREDKGNVYKRLKLGDFPGTKLSERKTMVFRDPFFDWLEAQGVRKCDM